MAGKEIAVKKYVVRLDAEERDRLNELIRKGKRSAQLLTKVRILLKAEVSDAGAAVTAGLPRRWTPASPLSRGPGASWSRKGWRRCWPANTIPTPPGRGFSTARRKQN